MKISKVGKNGLKLDGSGGLVLNNNSSSGIEIDRNVRDVEVTNFIFIGYNTKREAIVRLMPFLGYGKYKTKLIKAILWFF
jgi:hypothetical protein